MQSNSNSTCSWKFVKKWNFETSSSSFEIEFGLSSSILDNFKLDITSNLEVYVLTFQDIEFLKKVADLTSFQFKYSLLIYIWLEGE